MAHRHQRGWIKKEERSQGETWVLYFRTVRKLDGKRVENKIPIGLLKDFPDKSCAWGEIERLHLQINPLDSRRGITFADLAQHYAEHELVECRESIHLKAHTTVQPTSEFSATDCIHDGLTGLHSVLNPWRWSNG